MYVFVIKYDDKGKCADLYITIKRGYPTSQGLGENGFLQRSYE